MFRLMVLLYNIRKLIMRRLKINEIEGFGHLNIHENSVASLVILEILEPVPDVPTELGCI